MSKRKLRSLATAVLPLILLLSLAGVASAEWAVTEIVHSWDDGTSRYENGNVQMYLDGTWQPMHHDFTSNNQDEFDTTDYPNSCPGGLTSDFAGEADFSLDHTDNAPLGAEGFQSTRNWYIADCANIQVGGPQDPDKKYAEAADILWTCTTDNNDGDIDTCEIVFQDQVDPAGCQQGNCLDEIRTRVRVNFDNNCDGTEEPVFANAGALCLYWEAEKPAFPADSYWQGNIQVHVDQGGGRKTVNFAEPEGPNAVGMQSFTASAVAAGVSPAAVVATVLVVGLAGLALAWRSARG